MINSFVTMFIMHDHIIRTKVGKRRIKAVRPSIVLEVLDRLNIFVKHQRKKSCWMERRFLVGFLFWTGLRASEFLRVKRKDLDLASRLLHAPTLKQRGEYKITIGLYHVPDPEISLWEKHLAGKELDEYLTLGIRSRFGVWRAVNESFRIFGYDGVYPHMLRHSIAILLASLGTPLNVLQRFLRHSDPKNTSIYYSVAARDMEPYLTRVKRKILMRDGIIL